MATRFTRVTVVGDDRQLDVSLPAQQPVVTLVPQLCTLLSLKNERPGGPWTLSTVSSGILNPRLSLDEAGITDADILYLAPPQEAPEPPFIEDVVDETAARIDNADTVRGGLEWTGTARIAGSSALAAAALIALALLAYVELPNRAVTAATLVAAGVGAALLARVLRGRGGAFFAAAGVPAWALAGWAAAAAGDSDLPVGIGLLAIGAGVGLTAFWAAGTRWLAVTTTGVALTAHAAVASFLLELGLPTDRAAAVLVILTLFASGITPQIAVAQSGLVTLLRIEEKAERIRRDNLNDAIDTGQNTLTGTVTGTALTAAAATATLLQSSGLAAPLLGILTALVFALRSRAFTRTGQVLPMLAVPATGAIAAAIAFPTWLALTNPTAFWISTTIMLLTALAMVGMGVAKLDEVTAARLRRLADTTEAAAIILTVPLVLATFDAFAWIRDLVG